jgi:hypothetical protein
LNRHPVSHRASIDPVIDLWGYTSTASGHSPNVSFIKPMVAAQAGDRNSRFAVVFYLHDVGCRQLLTNNEGIGANRLLQEQQ